MDNYKTRITPAKEDAVKALKDEFAGYDSFIFTDYRGMTVEQITDIRKRRTRLLTALSRTAMPRLLSTILERPVLMMR